MSGCPCFWSNKSSSRWRVKDDDDDDDDDEKREAVVLVSGMGGSILESRKKKKSMFDLDTRVWVRLLLADLEFKNKLWSLYNPKTGYVEVLDDSTEILVPDDDYGLYAIDILDPSLFVKLLRLKEVYHFHDLIDMLVKSGYKKGTTLFGFGYDFRQSNRIDKSIDGLKARLETAYKASGCRKVNIISHSMGGLLVSCFLSLHNDVFSKLVNKWICIACPFQGAPGCINDSLLTGLQFVEGFQSNFFVSRWTMHQLVVECPSIYEMLPNPEFEWNTPPVIQVWRKKSSDEEDSVKLEYYGPLQSISLFEEALKNNELTYNGNTIAVPFNVSILRWTSGTRQILNNARLPEGVSFYNIYGTSIDTPYDVWAFMHIHPCCSYGTETSPIEDLTNVCHTLPQYSYVDGDGTVPTESAVADGFEAKERVGVEADHRGMLCDKTVFKYIQKWLGIEQNSLTKHPRTSKVVDASLHSHAPVMR